MKKFKNAIKRTSIKVPQFHPHHVVAPPSPPDDQEQTVDPNPPMVPREKLSLSSQDVSDIERPLFEKYWDELDPFGIGKVNLPYITTFLVSCHLSDHHIQQIIVLFEYQHEWARQHVYALLRLVSHIKHGRDINADLVYLPAPSVPVITERPTNCSYPLYTNYHQPRFRSFSDPSIFAVNGPFKNHHHHYRSVDDSATRKIRRKDQLLPSSLLLMQAFIPPPSPSRNNNPFCNNGNQQSNPYAAINSKSNHINIPPPLVPSQKTKPASLKHSQPKAPDKNIFDTPPHYHHHQPTKSNP